MWWAWRTDCRLNYKCCSHNVIIIMFNLKVLMEFKKNQYRKISLAEIDVGVKVECKLKGFPSN
jgi:hypothetical protein